METSNGFLEYFQPHLQAISRIFPDQFLHLGADEVRPQCWREDTELMAWAPAHGITGGTTGIFDFFEEKVR